MAAEHDWLYIFLALFVFVEFIALQVFSALATVPGDPAGLFPNTTEEISDAYPVQITPAGWTFIIWAIIYIFMLVYVVYIVACLCRKNKNGPVYLNPPVVPPAFLAVLSLNMAFNITWLFLFAYAEFVWSLADSCLLAFSAYICLFLSYKNVDKYRDVMTANHRFDLWCNRILIQNGISIYATWTSIATLLNLSIALTYNAGLANRTSCIISLSLLAVELFLYLIVDVFYWDRYLRYTLTVYMTVVWALLGTLLNNWDRNSTVSLLTASLLVISVACLVFKIVLMLYREPVKAQPSKTKPAEIVIDYEESLPGDKDEIPLK
ncbi:uncharacterized protein [Diadema setosum]|uniref:uncharacterized protein n=1 Tax=Diadema setosum TaxID=31175 RepID=UPI003B3B9C68